MARGLSDDELSALQQQLTDGKRPRVQLSGPHFPAGATGTVVRIGRPEVDGPDYLRVRVKVDNMIDELAFNPTELKLPGRATRARKAAAMKSTAAKAESRADAVPPAKAVPPGEPLIPAPARAPRRPAAKSAQSAQPAPAPARATAAVRRRTGPAQKVTFTVTSAGAAWSLAATRGSKNLIKNVALSPGIVGAIAELLDQAALSAAVSEINDAALAEAQQRADQLRAELSQLEAVLATHSRP